MSRTFNLVDEAWIPCITPDGAVEHQGIFQTLIDATRYAELRDPSPLVTVALHRMLLAVVHRVLGPESPEAWAELWQNGSGRFDHQKLEAYLKKPAIYSRFDLLDEQHPFYQTASLPRGLIDKETNMPKFVKPIWQMAHELACSDNMKLFAHVTENDWETRPAAEVARWLVAFQSFALGGLITTEEGRKAQDGSADAGQLVKSAVVLAKGENLFQTLALNLVHYSADDEVPFKFNAKADRAWERDDETRADDRPYDGYLDLLTWQSRRVKLTPEQDAEGNLLGVSGVVSMKGWQLPPKYWRYNYETMVGFLAVKDAKDTNDPWPPLGFRVGRDLWRDCHALLKVAARGSKQPRSISWLGDLRQSGHLCRKQVQLEIAGMSADRAKILLWRHESLPLPLVYLDKDKPELIESLTKIIRLAERVEKALRDSVWRAAVTTLIPRKENARLSKTERDAVERTVQSLGAEPLFWSRLERPFRQHVEELPGDASHRGKVIQQWFTATLQPTAKDAYRRTAGEMEASSRALRAAVSGEEALNRELGRIAAEYRFVSDAAAKETTNAAVKP